MMCQQDFSKLYTVSWKKVPMTFYFCLSFCKMLIDIQISFTGQTQQKMSGKTIIKYRTTTLWNICAQKSPCLAELSEVNSHARLSHSKQLLKNIHPLMLASFCSLTKTYLQWPHWKIHRITDCTYIHQPRRILIFWRLDISVDAWGALQIQDRSPQLRPVASECVCDWLRDATGLDCGDRSWISNAPQAHWSL